MLFFEDLFALGERDPRLVWWQGLPIPCSVFIAQGRKRGAHHGRYLIVDLHTHDPEGFQQYREGVPAFIAKHGGEYIVRGGEFEVIEGDWQHHRLVLFLFSSRRAIRDFFADPEYAGLKEMRFKTSKTIAIAMDGIE